MVFFVYYTMFSNINYEASNYWWHDWNKYEQFGYMYFNHPFENPNIYTVAIGNWKHFEPDYKEF
jgi:hypothetical protein